jgi:single-strand DNA-binding protein
VVVHGRLNQRSYDRDGVEVTVLEIDAVIVGHDLTRGISSFSKTVGAARRDARPQEPAVASAEQDPWAVSTAGSPEVAEVVAGAA